MRRASLMATSCREITGRSRRAHHAGGRFHAGAAAHPQGWRASPRRSGVGVAENEEAQEGHANSGGGETSHRHPPGAAPPPRVLREGAQAERRAPRHRRQGGEEIAPLRLPVDPYQVYDDQEEVGADNTPAEPSPPGGRLLLASSGPDAADRDQGGGRHEEEVRGRRQSDVQPAELAPEAHPQGAEPVRIEEAAGLREAAPGDGRQWRENRPEAPLREADPERREGGH